MADNHGEISHKDIVGKTVAGIVCHNYHRLNDILVVQDVHNNCKAIKLSSLSGNVELHTIAQQEVEQVQVTNNAKMFLFYTKTKQFLVNDQNQIVEDSDQWEDAYFDELSSSFYRKDAQGYWYDIEGFRMKEKVFLKKDILTSLETKTSKQSLSFKHRDIYISENKQLIQIGKLVLNLNLEVVKYFGEKITELGRTNIAFEGKDVLQEVRLGLEDSAFINEYTHEPYMFGDTKIIGHVATYQYGKKRVVVFQAEKKSYGVEGRSDNFLTYKESPLQIETEKYVSFNGAELIKVSDDKKHFYFDLNKNEAFSLPTLENINLSDIDSQYIRIGKSKIFNVSSPTEQFAVQERDGLIFKLDDGTIKPQKIEDAKGLKKYYGFALVDGQRKLFSKKHARILKFGKDALEVAQIKYNTSDKLINAIDTNGNKLVLDLRHGFEDISLAEINGDKISEVYGTTMPIGNKTLLNGYIETLGGSVRRVIDINEKVLSCFTLPSELTQRGDQDTPSVFADNLICEVHFFDEIIIEGKIFITADFDAYTGKEYSIILEKESGKPLHLQGIGHRNELATKWVDYTVKNLFYLGDNRMAGVKTISEDLKESELLFSVQKLNSWLPFYDSYLPIFKQIIEVEENFNDTWDYNLFELAELSKDKEYIVVEKRAPYRILADKKSGEYQPRIVKSKKKSIKSPNELTSLKRFFNIGSGILVEID